MDGWKPSDTLHARPHLVRVILTFPFFCFAVSQIINRGRCLRFNVHDRFLSCRQVLSSVLAATGNDVLRRKGFREQKRVASIWLRGTNHGILNFVRHPLLVRFRLSDETVGGC
ncbi:unnamed protein product [Hapterophycus canaliculatus]